MAIDLSAVLRAVGGELLVHAVAAQTVVDGLAELEQYVVIGNPRYATLVVGETDDLLRRLRAGGPLEAALAGAVFVSADDGDELRLALSQHRMTALVGTTAPQLALLAHLGSLIAEDLAAVDRLVTAGMKVLTQVARRGGVAAVAVELATQVDGWVVVLDAHGQLIASAGAGRLHIGDAVAFALGRPVRVRHRGLQAHQVGSDRDLVGHLVLSTRSRSISRSRDLGQQAAALCDLLLRTHNPSVTEELGRAALVEILLAGGDASATLLRSWGVHEPTLTAFVLGTKSRSMDLERLAARWLDELGAEHLFTGEAGQIAGFVRDDLVDELSGRVAALNPIGGGLVSLGLGVSAPVAALERSAIQARQAFRSAQESGQTVLRFAELRTVELVFDVLADHSSQQLAAVLDPLREANGEHGALTETLYVFLAEHGGLRASARSLEIHRQTLGARMRRIEALTGLSMNLPDDRAAAWLALRAVGS